MRNEITKEDLIELIDDTVTEFERTEDMDLDEIINVLAERVYKEVEKAYPKRNKILTVKELDALIDDFIEKVQTANIEIADESINEVVNKLLTRLQEAIDKHDEKHVETVVKDEPKPTEQKESKGLFGLTFDDEETKAEAKTEEPTTDKPIEVLKEKIRLFGIESE